MGVKMSKNMLKRNKFKSRYILLKILIIIIALLILTINIVYKNNKKIESSKAEENTNKEQEEAMLIELNNKKKEEEEKAREEAKEKEEEENATGVIYLTFDDGPSQDITPNVLDILAEKNVKATFFVIHYSDSNSSLVKREAKDGHTVALHGYTHTYSEVYSSADACLENFRKIQNQVYQTIGTKPNIIRFPGGSSNTISRKYCKRSHDRSNTKSVR